MNTAPVAPPVVSREIAPGVEIRSNMTGQEILNAHLKVAGQAPVETPKAPPQFHTNANVTTFANAERDAAARAAPAPGTPPQPTPAEKIAEFHRDMAKAGLAKAPPEPIEGVDPLAVEKLNKIYASLSPEDRAKNREIYNRDMLELHQGRRWHEQRSDFLARLEAQNQANAERAAAAEKPPARPTAAPAVTLDAALDVATKASNAEGYAPASSITGPLLFNYPASVLPTDMGLFHVAELTAGLRAARAANMSPAQVTAAIRALSK